MSAGIRYNVKYEYGNRLDEWLWEENTFEIWNSVKISASNHQVVSINKVVKLWVVVNMK